MAKRTFSQDIADELPFLRRYARALTGSQKTGDHYASATLEAILTDSTAFGRGWSLKTALFKVFHSLWHSTGAPSEGEETGLKMRAQTYLKKLTANSREALLLWSIEKFTYPEIGEIIGISAQEAEELVGAAYVEMEGVISGRILIIEDEPIIAFDLESLVTEIGHKVIGVARTRNKAIEIGNSEKPDLIMADIKLEDESSGVDAVDDLLNIYGNIPVIFITAFAKRLLNGEGREPAFLISKPYDEDQVRAAVSQALFFSSTEGINSMPD